MVAEEKKEGGGTNAAGSTFNLVSEVVIKGSFPQRFVAAFYYKYKRIARKQRLQKILKTENSF